MRRALAVELPAALLLAASARGAVPFEVRVAGVYDDLAMIDRALKAGGQMTYLVPEPRIAASRSGDLNKQEVRWLLGELRWVLAAVKVALCWEDDPAAIARHRRKIADSLEALVARVDAYREAAVSLTSCWRRVLRVRESHPDCPRTSPLFRDWSAEYRSAVAHYNALREEVKRSYSLFTRTHRDTMLELTRIRLPVDLLYRKGVVAPRRLPPGVLRPAPAAVARARVPAGPAPPGAARPGEANPGRARPAPGRPSRADFGEPGRAASRPASARPAKDPGPVRVEDNGALRGSARALVTVSACSVEEYKEAVEEKDHAFLGALAGRLVVLRAMILERPKEQDGRVCARLHAAGGEVPAEFPATSEVIGLRAGRALVAAGEPRDAGGGWVLRVIQWRAADELDRGRAMFICRWPEAETGGPR